MSIWSGKVFPSLWSATPTPFTETMNIDEPAVERLVEHHIQIGAEGLFLAGTCGEGPWMPLRERRRLVRRTRAASRGSLLLAVQVSDNSVERILENAGWAMEDGADIAVIAPPQFMLNASPRAVADFYLEAIRRLPMPVCIYDRPGGGDLGIRDEFLQEVYGEDNVVMIKDSSCDPARNAMALEVRRGRPDLRLFTGDEFNCVRYLVDGYDGLLIGGAVFNGVLARLILGAVQRGDVELARQLQERMNRLMYAVYGGKEIRCWLSGLKKLLVEMGIFGTWRNYPDYPLTGECEAAIFDALATEREILLPNGVFAGKR